MLNLSPSNRRLLHKRRRDLLKNPTVAELHVKGLLDQLGEEYLFQKGFLTNKRHFIVDFYLKRRKKLCLEVDGGYHSSPSQIEYDRIRDDYLTRVRGFRVLRITNEQAMRLSAEDLAKLIS